MLIHAELLSNVSGLGLKKNFWASASSLAAGADSDYVPNSLDETTTDYSTDDDISKVAKLITIKHGRPVVYFGSSEVVESVRSPNAGPSS